MLLFRFNFLRRCRHICATAVCAAVCTVFTLPGSRAAEPAKGYRLLNVPQQWRFSTLSPAYDLQSGEKLGNFQPGIRVQVIEADPDTGKWHVRYSSFGSPDVDALIDWPSAASSFPERWARMQSELEQAPLLDQILGSDAPWPDSLPEAVKTYFGDKVMIEAGTKDAPERILTKDTQVARLWGMVPAFAAVEYAPDRRPMINIEFWNKTDRLSANTFPSRSVNNAYHLLREKLESLSRNFESNLLARNDSGDRTLSLIREQREVYPLANATQAVLRYQRGEYLILELRPFDPPLPSGGNNRTDSDGQSQQRLSERLRGNITEHKDGYRYLAGIPMINQGTKGYCAAATLARVLQYYGYQVDMHQMANLAATDNQGTTYRDMISAMRRVCNTTPYRFRRITSRNRAELTELSIERGMPLIWLVPGHARLLIGINPNGGIVYSDSWGPGHEFKTMQWSDFLNITTDLFLLDVGNN